MNVIKGEVVAVKTEKTPRRRIRPDSLERIGAIYEEAVRATKTNPAALFVDEDAIPDEERACAALGHMYVGCGKYPMCSPRELDEDGQPIEPSIIEHRELMG